MPVNYTFTMEKNFNTDQGDILPWVKLTLPDCAQFETGKSLVIYDPTKSGEERFVSYQKYSLYDYVFQLHDGINFLTLMNLRNPQEACLWKSRRISFEFRTYEDQQLQYIMDQRVEGLEPSLSCKSNCATCETIDKSFCKSCHDPIDSLLVQDTGKCIPASNKCPTGYYMVTLEHSQNKVCKRCETGCKNCEDQSGICKECDSSKNLLLNKADLKCISNDSCKRDLGLIVIDGTCEKCHSDCKECGDNSNSPILTSVSKTHSPLYCTKCSNT